MSAHPEYRYVCDRCGTEEIVPLQNTPAGSRAAGPSGWQAIVVGTEPSLAPKHLCGICVSQFDYFMGNHR